MDKICLEIDGWMQENEMEWLEKTIQTLPDDSLIVELGSWKGRSTSVLYKAINEKQAVVTVDSWLGQKNLRETGHSEVYERDIFLEFLENMNALGIYPTWYNGQKHGTFYLRLETQMAYKRFPYDSIDMLFIDADHTTVGEDIDMWYRKVKPGAIICGHDYEWEGASVAIKDRLEVEEILGSLWYSHKPDFALDLIKDQL